ncbi:MAG: hypothetical protein ACXWDO_08465 [Bacteroidia bacterium]
MEKIILLTHLVFLPKRKVIYKCFLAGENTCKGLKISAPARGILNKPLEINTTNTVTLYKPFMKGQMAFIVKKEWYMNIGSKSYCYGFNDMAKHDEIL